MKKTLKVLTPNRKLNYRGKQVRTPVTITADSIEIERLQIELRKLGNIKFLVEPLIENQKTLNISKLKEPTIEKIEEPLTILQKLLKTKD